MSSDRQHFDLFIFQKNNAYVRWQDLMIRASISVKHHAELGMTAPYSGMDRLDQTVQLMRQPRILVCQRTVFEPFPKSSQGRNGNSDQFLMKNNLTHVLIVISIIRSLLDKDLITSMERINGN